MTKEVFLNECHTVCHSLETCQEQILDSPSKSSFIGSYYQPPDRILPVPRQLDFPAHSPNNMNLHTTSTRMLQNKPNIDSQGVVDALKTLQEKIRKLELERKQAEKSYQQFSQDVQKHEQYMASYNVHNQPAVGLSETDGANRKELDAKLQSAEARCQVLEKQLDYMRKMVENAKKERHVLIEEQASLQNQNRPRNSNAQTQQEKLERLESDYLKLGRTQTLAEMKLATLEQRLLKEERERKLVQEKAEELQRELDINVQLSRPAAEEINPKRKTKRTTKKTLRPKHSASPSGPRCKKVPFVTGTSTSPSHSVHANVQSILHMMKHHQPQLCERVRELHGAGSGAKKSLQKSFSAAATDPQKPDSRPEQAAASLGSLSDLLLALQDELGQMSFEHQELMQQIDSAEQRQHRLDLQRELESLVARMEEKGAQITKLRKHQQAVQTLTMTTRRRTDETTGVRSPSPSPARAKPQGKKGGAAQSNLQLLRETQRFRNCLKQEDIRWET